MSNSSYSHLSSSNYLKIKKFIKLFSIWNIIRIIIKLIFLEHLKPLICIRPEEKNKTLVKVQKLKENFNPLSRGSKFRFTGKVDFLSQINRVKGYENSDNLFYLNGQLISKENILPNKQYSQHSTNDDLKSYINTQSNFNFF